MGIIQMKNKLRFLSYAVLTAALITHPLLSMDVKEASPYTIAKRLRFLPETLVESNDGATVPPKDVWRIIVHQIKGDAARALWETCKGMANLVDERLNLKINMKMKGKTSSLEPCLVPISHRNPLVLSNLEATTDLRTLYFRGLNVPDGDAVISSQIALLMNRFPSLTELTFDYGEVNHHWLSVLITQSAFCRQLFPNVNIRIIPLSLRSLRDYLYQKGRLSKSVGPLPIYKF